MEKDITSMIHHDPQVESVQITGAITPEFAEILTPEAVNFVTTLARAFTNRREELLQRRVQRQAEIDAGKMPDFLPETEYIRAGVWKIAPVPADLQDRRVEITGPVER
jgi:malate synthase